MSSLSGWSNLESFLTSTTPVVTPSYPFSKLISAFKIPCAFGVEVKLTEQEIIYFLPTLSAINLPSFSFYEDRPPFSRPSAYQMLSTLCPNAEIDENSWVALLWVPINKLPPGKVYGSILVYYQLYSGNSGYLPVQGLVSYKVPEQWANVYDENGKLNYQLTRHWEEMRKKMGLEAHEFQAKLSCLHHDFNFIVCRDNNRIM